MNVLWDFHCQPFKESWLQPGVRSNIKLNLINLVSHAAYKAINSKWWFSQLPFSVFFFFFFLMPTSCLFIFLPGWDQQWEYCLVCGGKKV